MSPCWWTLLVSPLHPRPCEARSAFAFSVIVRSPWCIPFGVLIKMLGSLLFLSWISCFPVIFPHTHTHFAFLRARAGLSLVSLLSRAAARNLLQHDFNSDCFARFLLVINGHLILSPRACLKSPCLLFLPFSQIPTPLRFLLRPLSLCLHSADG